MSVQRLRPMAETDLVDRTTYYRREGGEHLGERFFQAATAAFRGIEQMPGTGSPRAGDLSGIRGLRVCRVPGFPCGWFYLADTGDIDVIRLLADAQDLALQFSGLDT